jgi:hypothetical protein
MKKTILLLLLVTLFGSIPKYTQALDLEAIAKLNGNESPAGTLYIPITNDTKLITGISAILPGTKTKSVDLDFHFGLSSPIPIIGITEYILTFSKWSPETNTGTQPGTALHLNSLLIRKNYLFKLTDKVNIGFQAILAEVMLQGDKIVKVFPGFYPILGATIQFP